MSLVEPARLSQARIPIVALSLFVIFLIAVLAWAHGVGRNALAAAQLVEQTEITRENKEFCTDLGLKERASDYTRCVRGLDHIRRRQKERWDSFTADLP